MNKSKSKYIIALVGISLSLSMSYAQEGRILQLEIQSPALKNNLTKEANTKNVFVYLPPDYDKNKTKQYPVVYLLHGFGGQVGSKQWFEFMGDSVIQVSHLNKMIHYKIIQPMIIVMPDGHNIYGGGFYTNSITTGNWEDYVYQDVVQFIENKFRIIKDKNSRGIAGHSMGGYGALKIAIKHPDIFSVVYTTSACCLGISESENDYSEKDIKEAIHAGTWSDFNKLQFFSRAIIASAAAWSPNPSKPPFYADLPFSEQKNDSTVDAAIHKMAANVPLWMVDQNVPNIQKLKGISLDVGSKEESIKSYNIKFSNLLNRHHIKHEFMIFDGGHVDKLKEQVEHYLLPYFSKTLKF